MASTLEQSDLQAAKHELKELLTTLFRKLDDLQKVEDDLELDPDKNIIENFFFKQQMKCEPCKILFDSWSELDLHSATHHSHQPGDQRCCSVCGSVFESWQERDSHMLMDHPLDSNTTQAPILLSDNNAMWCCSLCSGSKHYVDKQHWQNHFDSFHARSIGSISYNWMVTQCDIKGRGIVFDANAELECKLCNETFTYNPDIFNFDLCHGQTSRHIENLKKFIKERNKLPVKFLQVLNSQYEISGLFHPHELQSSCCCRILGCEFCGLHKSMLNTFTECSVVCCNVCKSNFKWTNVQSGIQHVKSNEHYKNLCNYTLNTGCIPSFNDIFKEKGQFIESISTARQMLS